MRRSGPAAALPPAELSVRAVLPRLVEALAHANAAVVVAPPGSGKTTLVPPALRAAGAGGGRRIVMLEPRRIAARAAARRIADQGGWRLGAEVGYQVRFERRASAATEILVATEGILVQMLQGDPFLDGVGVLIFDELHERSLATDLALGMARQVQREARPDLALLAMSATLDPGPIAEFLGGCPVLTAPGRPYPVEVVYLDERQAARAGRGQPAAAAPGGRGGTTSTGALAVLVSAVRRALDATAGDVLVFLPGVGEILRAAAALAELAARLDLAVLPLYGDLPAERQDEVLRPAGRRKVVLATNVAETSITIDGIAAVVDTGLARRLRYDPAAGLDRLELVRISRAAADQRAGRAGRQGPGLCLRLWPAREQADRPAHETPEIARVDLAGPALQLLAWGETDIQGTPQGDAAWPSPAMRRPRLAGSAAIGDRRSRGRLATGGAAAGAAGFRWFEAPAAESLGAARRLLAALGAIGEDAAPGGAAGGEGRWPGVTALGRQMARLPAHPRLARLLLEGRRLGVAREAALLAALLAERDPFIRPSRQRHGLAPDADRHAAAVQASRSDLLDRLDALLRWEAAGARDEPEDGGGAAAAPGRLNAAAARFVLRARDQLVELAGDGPEAAGRRHRGRRGRPRPGEQEAAGGAAADRDDALLRSLFAAYPDRLARRREPHSPRAVMVGGRGVRLAAESAVTGAGLFVCIEVIPGPPGPQAEDLVRLASEVAPEWLPPERLRTAIELEFDGARERVAAWQRTRYADLVIAEREVPPPDGAAAALLAEAASARLPAALPLDDPEVASFLVRLRCLADWMPELGLPRLDAAAVAALLPELARGRRSFAELRRAPLLERLRGALTWQQLATLEREAPERLVVPSGSRIRLTYEEGKPPVLAARIQELFGLAETPRIAGGRVPVLLHLLAPNLRPQQVTADLRSFWRDTYWQVRKELQGRYPRHAWPEDPWNALPERRPAPRRPRRPT